MIFWGAKIIAGERSLKIPYGTKAVNNGKMDYLTLKSLKEPGRCDNTPTFCLFITHTAPTIILPRYITLVVVPYVWVVKIKTKNKTIFICISGY